MYMCCSRNSIGNGSGSLQMQPHSLSHIHNNIIRHAVPSIREGNYQASTIVWVVPRCIQVNDVIEWDINYLHGAHSQLLGESAQM